MLMVSCGGPSWQRCGPGKGATTVVVQRPNRRSGMWQRFVSGLENGRSISERADRFRSDLLGSGRKAALEQRWDGALFRRVVAILWHLRSVRRRRPRSQGGDEPGEGFARFWIWLLTLIGLLGVLRWVVGVRRRCAPRRRSGAGGWNWMQVWWAAEVGSRGRWRLGRASAFGSCWWFLVSVCFVSSWLVMFVCCLACLCFLISFYHVSVGCSGLCAGICISYAWSALGWRRVPCFGKWSLFPGCSSMFALGRRRVPCFVKWSLPPSGRVKPSVAGCFVQWQYDGKAVRMEIMLSCNRVADQVIFPSCHRCVTYVKANGDASSALLASWCLFGYMFVVEAPVIISGSSLNVLYNLGFRSHVPPMYSVVSLIKA